MAVHADIPRVAMQVSRGVVVVSIQLDLDEDVLGRFREDLLTRLHETGLRAVILDVSGLEILDSAELFELRRIISMAELMGARSVLVGLRPGVVSALVDADADIDGLEAAIDLDAAFDMLDPDLATAIPADGEPAGEKGGEKDTSKDGGAAEAAGAPGEAER